MDTPGQNLLKQAVLHKDVTSIIDALRYDDTRKEASNALANLGEEALYSLFDMLMTQDSMDEEAEESEETYQAVYRTLRKIGEPATAFVVKVLEGWSPYYGTETCSFFRETAAMALAYLDDPKAIEPLKKCLDDENEDYQVKNNVVWALERLGILPDDSRSIRLLNRIFPEGNLEARLATCEALGMYGDQKALPALRWLERNETNDVVKEAVFDAIDRVRRRWDEE